MTTVLFHRALNGTVCVYDAINANCSICINGVEFHLSCEEDGIRFAKITTEYTSNHSDLIQELSKRIGDVIPLIKAMLGDSEQTAESCFALRSVVNHHMNHVGKALDEGMEITEKVSTGIETFRIKPNVATLVEPYGIFTFFRTCATEKISPDITTAVEIKEVDVSVSCCGDCIKDIRQFLPDKMVTNLFGGCDICREKQPEH